MVFCFVIGADFLAHSLSSDWLEIGWIIWLVCLTLAGYIFTGLFFMDVGVEGGEGRILIVEMLTRVLRSCCSSYNTDVAPIRYVVVCRSSTDMNSPTNWSDALRAKK